MHLTSTFGSAFQMTQKDELSLEPHSPHAARGGYDRRSWSFVSRVAARPIIVSAAAAAR
jgi:hypothetical protein